MMQHTRAIADNWTARWDNKGASVALITLARQHGGRASTTPDTAATPHVRQRQKNKCHCNRLDVGQGLDQQARPRQQGSWHIYAGRHRCKGNTIYGDNDAGCGDDTPPDCRALPVTKPARRLHHLRLLMAMTMTMPLL
jgi:hypothetical protein